MLFILFRLLHCPVDHNCFYCRNNQICLHMTCDKHALCRGSYTLYLHVYRLCIYVHCWKAVVPRIVFRRHSLYSLVCESSDELKIGPMIIKHPWQTRKVSRRKVSFCEHCRSTMHCSICNSCSNAATLSKHLMTPWTIWDPQRSCHTRGNALLPYS